VIYNFASFQLNSYLKGWSEQNIISSPPVTDYLLGYAILLPLIFVGILRVLRSQMYGKEILFGWIILLPFLVYVPNNLQRRLAEGSWVPLVVLCLLSLKDLKINNSKWIHGWLLLSFLSTFMFLVGGVIIIFRPALPLYRTSLEVDAFEELRNHVLAGQVVLADFDTSNAIPAWVPVRTLIGHGPESLNLATLKPRVDLFFHPETTDLERVSLIKQFHISYIIYGPIERSLGNWDPGSLPYLVPIIQKGAIQIYKVDYSFPILSE